MSSRVRSRRLRGREDGFTLIELMVAVLIVGILITIALPTFLGARQRAQNRAAQSDLRSAMSAAEVYYTTRRTYVGFTVAVARTIEPAITWRARGNPVTPGRVSIGGPNPTATQIQLVAISASGTYYCIKDVTTGAAAGTRYGRGAAYANVDAANECALTKW